MVQCKSAIGFLYLYYTATFLFTTRSVTMLIDNAVYITTVTGVWLVLDHTHLLLDEGDVGEDEKDVPLKQKQLSEDEYLSDQCLPSPRGE